MMNKWIGDSDIVTMYAEYQFNLKFVSSKKWFSSPYELNVLTSKCQLKLNTAHNFKVKHFKVHKKIEEIDSDF